MVARGKHPNSIANLTHDGAPPQFGKPKVRTSIQLSEELLSALNSLPLIDTPIRNGGWSKGYLMEVVLRNWLEMPADYDWGDLELIKRGHKIE